MAKNRQNKWTKNYQQTSVLAQNNKIISSRQEIANTFAQHCRNSSSNELYTNEFQIYKKDIENVPSEINPQNENPVNVPITKQELTDTIQHLKNNSFPGPDGINYEMMKYLPRGTRLYTPYI